MSQLQHERILRDLKKTGYDGVEIPMFEGDPEHYARLGALLDKIGLERTVVSVLGPGNNPLAADKAQQQAALARAKWAIDCSAALGAPILAGPMHSELGFFSGNPATAAERKRGLTFHRRAGDYAAKKNVRFALEALNRFECYFLNTMEQLSDYLDEVDHPAVKAMYDTFHSNIEEKDPVGAIKTIRKHMIHVHISENDRGTPGKGHVPWAETYKALASREVRRLAHHRSLRPRHAGAGGGNTRLARLLSQPGRGLQVRLQEHEARLGQGQVSTVYVIGTSTPRRRNSATRWSVSALLAPQAVLVDISTTPSTASADVDARDGGAASSQRGRCRAGPCRPRPGRHGHGRGPDGFPDVTPGYRRRAGARRRRQHLDGDSSDACLAHRHSRS